jgi:hypothetical protein
MAVPLTFSAVKCGLHRVNTRTLRTAGCGTRRQIMPFPLESLSRVESPLAEFSTT